MNTKLKRANNLISISRHYIPKNLLSQIYYGQFFSHLTYGCQLWGGNDNTISKTFTLQKKAICLIAFKDSHEPSSPLFKELKMLKLSDIIKLNNILFTHASLNNQTPPILHSFYKHKQFDNRAINITSTHRNLPGSLKIPPPQSDTSKTSLPFICPSLWNLTHRTLSKQYPEKYNKDPRWLQNISTSSIKQILKQHYLGQY